MGNWSNYRSNYFLKSLSQAVHLLEIKEHDNLESYESKVKRYLVDPADTTFMKLSPVQIFFIDDISMEYFELALHRLKNSAWWNIHGFFFIKNVQTINSCESSHFYLDMLWKFSISTAVFLCHDSDLGISLYTFNPYSALTPVFWRKIASYVSEENGNAFTLFRNINQTIGGY